MQFTSTFSRQLYCLYPALRQQGFTCRISKICSRTSKVLTQQTVDSIQCRQMNSQASRDTSGLRHSEAEGVSSETEATTTAPRKKLGPWRPLKRLTRYEMNHMRSLRELQPEEWTITQLAKRFGVSDSAVKRILRSQFDPSSEVEQRQDRRAQELRQKRKERLSTNSRVSNTLHNTNQQYKSHNTMPE